MPTRRIDHSEWKTYLEQFSARHQGATVTVLNVNPEAEQVLVQNEPFVGISFEEKGSESGHIILIVGGEASNNDQHVITSPKAIIHKDGTTPFSDEVNKDEELEITSAGVPPITLITLRHAHDDRLEFAPHAGLT